MTTVVRRVPALSVRPRSSLSLLSCAGIDGVLKDIKVFTRRLRAAMAKQGEELRILERLYYKGKNQHRAALFWKRVSELRRYARRLDGMALPDIVDHLRHSFFGGGAPQRYRRISRR